jgi:hypothetical protein
MTRLREALTEVEFELDILSRGGTEIAPTLALEALRSVFSSSWIACSARMPAADTPVWFVIQVFGEQRVTQGRYRDNRWQDYAQPVGYGYGANAVTHWMPRLVDDPPEFL